ncbi:MATE efflux family protein [Medicago truncatula]|uniref:Protein DETOXIFICATION n=1 Tax=Medicago truncatula TaxID=3880 RepID=A0A072UBY9_MEDTR|nr:MATE efflux family protein [Medicago truncatula]
MKIGKKEIIEESKKQLCLQIISLMFVGHLDHELLLAGASLAISFVNVTGFNVLMGMSSALDTFCGQAYGAQQYHMVGIYTQRAMLATTIVSIPLSFIWAYLKPILIILHQDKTIATQAQLFARYSIPSLSANGLLRCIIKFLQTQNIVFPMVLANGFISLIHVILCWVLDLQKMTRHWALVIKFGLGIKGAAIAICISNWLNVVILALYIKFSSSFKRTWVGLSMESLHDIPQFLKLALPSTVMVCLESWTFEIMVLLSGALPNPKLQTSVLSICINVSGMFWMIPFGVSVAGSTRISNELGAGCPNAAYLAVIVTLFMAFTCGILEFSFIMSAWKLWGKAFSNVHEVVTYVTSMIPIVATSAFVDSFQTPLQGVARGCGWQKLGAFVNLGAYYLVGIPISVVLAFVFNMKGQGLLLGLLTALIVQVMCFLIVTLRTNWEKEANKAAIRVAGSGVQVNALSLDQNAATP